MYYFRTLQNNQSITHMNTHEYCYEMTKNILVTRKFIDIRH